MNALQTESLAKTAAQQEITEELYGRFIAYLDAKPKTIQTYTGALRQLMRYFALHGVTRPRREDILAFRDELRNGHKPTTVQSYITAARLFFQWLDQEGIYPNVAGRIKGAKLDKEHKKDYLTSGQVRAVLDGIDRKSSHGMRDYAILAVMVTGGLRTAEVAQANIEDFRSENGSGNNDAALFIQGKGRDERTEYVRLDPRVERALQAYLETRSTAKQTDPLFVSTSNNSAGARLTTRSISGIVKERLRDAGFDSDRLTAHSLRHTAVTLSLLAGKRLEEVQQFARHASVTTTQIYNHALDRAKNSCSEAIAEGIFNEQRIMNNEQ